jgi:ABC-type bacteriocin/lantibiotic exporter with double-glycine peptidase domain
MKARFRAPATTLIGSLILASWLATSLEANAATSDSALVSIADHSGRTVSLEVPIVVQAKERCGPAALEMVLRHYGASAAALEEAERAYDPVLNGTLITELAAAARLGGFDAVVTHADAESLVAMLGRGVPPIVLYQSGRPPLTTPHFGVVTAWDAKKKRFTVNEGRSKARSMGESDLLKRWKTAGSQALVVTRRTTP